jgi:hypothetical protein
MLLALLNNLKLAVPLTELETLLRLQSLKIVMTPLLVRIILIQRYIDFNEGGKSQNF